GRIAAKEAARRLWSVAGRPATYPADLAVVADDKGRPRLIRVDQPDDDSLPSVSIAHTDGVSVALAAPDSAARVGIDVETIVDRPAEFEVSAFTPGEQLLLNRWSRAARAEWVARFWSAKGAAAKAIGIGLAAGPSNAEVVHVDDHTGV